MSGNVDPYRSLIETKFIVTEGFQSFADIRRFTHEIRDEYVESLDGVFSPLYSYSFHRCETQNDHKDSESIENSVM